MSLRSISIMYFLCTINLLILLSLVEQVTAEMAPPPDPPTAEWSFPQIQMDTGGVEYEPLSTATTEWVYHKTADGQNPSGIEQQQLWFVNRARSNPTDEGIWLATETHQDVAGGRSYFGVDTDLLQTEFAIISPMPPAAFDRRLYEAAKAHSLDLIDRDKQDHVGQDNLVLNSGFSCLSWGGVVFSYTDSGLYAHAAFNIDWGYGDFGMQEGRGHRVALMSDGQEFFNVGIASVAVTESGKKVGPYVTTGNYCKAKTSETAHFNVFIVGTVWQDLNDNGWYDEGEGFGGVTVMPDRGTYYAVTGDAGGYAIPVDPASITGKVTVSFSGGDLSQPGVETGLLSGDSILIDHKLVPELNVYYLDQDQDGYGDNDETITAFTLPGGYVLDNTDCDDSRADIYPGAAEQCDGVDNDCNGQTDEGVMTTWYQDFDQDLYGNATINVESCTAPAGYVTDNTDCDDTDFYAHPGQVWFSDQDNDGYSNGVVIEGQCERPAGYKAAGELLSVSGDTDDGDETIYPGVIAVLTTKLIPGDGGIISSVPLGISCGDVCEVSYPVGTEIVLSATSSSGYRFVGWSVEQCDQTATCSFVLGGDVEIEAYFQKIQFPWELVLPALISGSN